MFSKLLKYDSKAVFKYWWIGALSSVVIAILGGVCIQIVDVDYTQYELIPILAGIGIFFSVLGVALLPFFTMILVIVRYYKHFFTDEGYLTFTLPVKKTALLDSKVVTTFIFSFTSAVLTLLNVLVMLAVGLPEGFFDPFLWKNIFRGIGEIYSEFGIYGVPYTILAVLILAVSTVLQTLFIFVCITLAASIAKKHKVLAAIGIYYGASLVTSFVIQILAFGGVSTVFTLISELAVNPSKLAVLFILLGVFGILTVLVSALYLFMLYLLDKRLNLE